MKQILRALFILLCGAFLTGCPPFSKNPISAPQDSAPDPGLAGRWSSVTLRIMPGRSPWMHAEQSDGGQVQKYDFFPSVVGNHRFLNVHSYEPMGKGRFKRREDYFFLRYEIGKDGTLSFWSIPKNKAAQIVRSGKLKGRIEKNDDVYFEDSSKNLQKFLQQANIKALFSERQNGIYQRMSSR